MVLYTLLSYDEIFQFEGQYNELIEYKGRQCFVSKRHDGSMQIEQLLSTDPQDFLYAHFNPGTIIERNTFFS